MSYNYNQQLLRGYMVASVVMDLLGKAEFLHVPVMNVLHDIKDNTFINTEHADATGLEAAGNYFLQPVRYLFNGKTVCQLKATQSFDYAKESHTQEFIKTALAVISLPFSLIVGAGLKGLSYLSAATRQRHDEVDQVIHSRKIVPLDEEYKALGIPQIFSNERLEHQGHKHPGLTEHQKLQVRAVQDVSKRLREVGTAHWLDCGTLLGDYRYGDMIPWDGDVDMGGLAKDYKNIMAALRSLDSRKYEVQDWSCSRMPEMFIRVLIKEANAYIDIYLHEIESSESIRYKYSWTDSPWVPDMVKARETCMEKSIKIKDVFPLKKADFAGVEVAVPNNWEAFLKVKYGPNIDPCKVWNPETRQYEKVANHPYWIDHEY